MLQFEWWDKPEIRNFRDQKNNIQLTHIEKNNNIGQILMELGMVKV